MTPVLTPIAILALILTASLAMADDPEGSRRLVDLDSASKHPAPGTTVPTAIAFSPDGSSVSFLLPEGEGPARVLWRSAVAEGAVPEVVARPPGEGTGIFICWTVMASYGN